VQGVVRLSHINFFFLFLIIKNNAVTPYLESALPFLG
jgi:hypothetical protein